MEINILPPAAVTQKVIAMNTTMKEVCQKLLSENVEKSFAEKLEKALDQSHHFTDQLMNELSNYGDAVSSQIDRDEDYEKMANKMMESNNDSAEGKVIEFEKFGERVQKIYRDILSDKNELPESLKIMLEDQLSKMLE